MSKIKDVDFYIRNTLDANIIGATEGYNKSPEIGNRIIGKMKEAFTNGESYLKADLGTLTLQYNCSEQSFNPAALTKYDITLDDDLAKNLSVTFTTEDMREYITEEIPEEINLQWGVVMVDGIAWHRGIDIDSGHHFFVSLYLLSRPDVYRHNVTIRYPDGEHREEWIINPMDRVIKDRDRDEDLETLVQQCVRMNLGLALEIAYEGQWDLIGLRHIQEKGACEETDLKITRLDTESAARAEKATELLEYYYKVQEQYKRYALIVEDLKDDSDEDVDPLEDNLIAKVIASLGNRTDLDDHPNKIVRDLVNASKHARA